MNANLLLTACLLAANISHAQNTPGTARQTEPATPQTERQRHANTYETHVQGMIAHKTALANALAQATDKNTAETAARKAAQTYRQMHDYFSSTLPGIKTALEELPVSEVDAINSRHQQARDTAEQTLDKEVLRISLHDAFGNEPLAHLITDIIASGLIPVANLQQELTDPEALQKLEHAMRAYYTQMIGNLQTLLAEIQSIHDKTTADAAAARIRTFFSEQQKTEETAFADMVHTYGTPPDTLKQKIMDEFLPQLRQCQTTSEELKHKLEQTNFYGSQELQKALNQQPEA